MRTVATLLPYSVPPIPQNNLCASSSLSPSPFLLRFQYPPPMKQFKKKFLFVFLSPLPLRFFLFNSTLRKGRWVK